MTSPTLKKSINRNRRLGQERFHLQPLVTRRFAAWVIEVSLIAISGVVPFTMGMYIESQPGSEQVPLNPVLAVTEAAIARTLALPSSDNRKVPPLTNFFWSVALVAPILLSSWQLYLLATTGSTLPKRWFNVRVVTATGNPGMPRVLLREGIGSWGLPLLIAYLLWWYSGASSLSLLVELSWLTVLGEGMSARFHRQRRCLHDLLAGTYVVDANRSTVPFLGPLSGQGRSQSNWESYRSITFVPPVRRQQALWKWMRQHPNLTLLLVALSSMAAVLGTLVGTQVYIQTQANQRTLAQNKSKQFLTLMKQLSLSAPTNLAERQRAILALGTLNDPQALQLLVALLGQETVSELIDAIQQALVSTGPRSLPYLQRLNQSFSSELDPLRYTRTPQEQVLRIKRLQATQFAIAKVLAIYSGKVHKVDLSRTDLSQTSTDSATFNLALNKIDLSGIQLRGANLNKASFRNSHLRSVGVDGRWNTADDWIADLSDAQLKAADLTAANLSRILMNRTNLSRAILNGANLSSTSLNGANLSSTHLVGANLSDAVLANASLTGADLGAANLSRANLYAARLGRVSALGTQLQLANLSKSDWRGADLSKADLSRADLRNADFSTTRLNSVNLRNAQLQNANLRNSDLSLADLRGANLAGADLHGTVFVQSKLAPAAQFVQTPRSDLQSALVEGVDFTKVKNLNPQQLAYICTQGGRHPRCP